MPDQGGFTRSQIIDQISFQKVEHERALSKYRAIGSEISRLEDVLLNMGESLNNPRSCMNQGVFAQGKCDQCGLRNRCVFEGKGQYHKYNL